MSKQQITIDEVKHVAKLAQLPLSDEETKKFDEAMSQTVEYVSHLDELDTTSVEPTFQVTGKTNEFRDDVVLPSLPVGLALKNAKATHNNLFVSKVSWG